MAKGWRARSWRLYVTLSLTTAFFFVELIVGNATNSTTLVADAFHMLSDIFSLIIGIMAIRVRFVRYAQQRPAHC
jgi:solute carrier family 30 (zinc transporter), member 1